jgi:hypothetical protein
MRENERAGTSVPDKSHSVSELFRVSKVDQPNTILRKI